MSCRLFVFYHIAAIGLRASTSVRVDDECTPDSTRPVRSGERFKFNLIGEDAKCVDDEGNLYSYGLFEGVEDNEKCADACVNGVSSELAAALQGYNFKCGAQECEWYVRLAVASSLVHPPVLYQCILTI